MLPRDAISSACFVTAGIPTHSMITSAPSPPNVSLTLSERSPFSGSTAASAPSRSPVSLRNAIGSLKSTFEAPDSFASCTIMSPMAPPPITRTVFPGRIPARSIPWMQQASGSVMAAYARGIFSSIRKHCVSGAQQYSANPPSRFTPMA